MRFLSYLNTASLLIKTYDGSMPLVHLLKHYFAQYKKHGSRDRKLISHLCYCYYRLGHSVDGLPLEEKIKLALFLCNDEAGQWAVLFDETWLKNWSKNVDERIAFVQQQITDFVPSKIFPWKDELSEAIDREAFSLSHLLQPFLFLRTRPKHEQTVVQRLRDMDIPFQKMSPTALALANGTKLDGVLDINKEVVVQDLSSQNIASFITPELIQLSWAEKWTVWDCCTASGGKTILLNDTHPNNQLLLTDIRESMLHQLKPRLDAANIGNWKFEVADLTKQKPISAKSTLFDFIIADVPCTGSGTWSRTPEQLDYFTPQTIEEFAAVQKKIVSNVVPHLKANGYFLYITCSAFKKENEEVVAFIKENFQLELVKMEILKGYDKKADTMFGALFTKPTA